MRPFLFAIIFGLGIVAASAEEPMTPRTPLPLPAWTPSAENQAVSKLIILPAPIRYAEWVLPDETTAPLPTDLYLQQLNFECAIKDPAAATQCKDRVHNITNLVAAIKTHTAEVQKLRGYKREQALETLLGEVRVLALHVTIIERKP